MNVHATTAPWSRTATQSRSGRQTGDAGADSAEQVVDVVAEQRRAAGDRQRDENDQHCVFGRGRAAIVTAKAFEPSEHVHTPEIERVTDPFAPGGTDAVDQPRPKRLVLRSGSVWGNFRKGMYQILSGLQRKISVNK